MKKIIFTVSNDISYDQRMNRICESLSNKGYAVLIVGRKRRNSIPLIPTDFEIKRWRCLFNFGPLFYAEYNLRLLFFLLLSRCDLICAVDLDTILAVKLAARLKRKKCIYDAHEYFTEVPELMGRNWTKRVWNLIAEYTVPKMDACYTVNDSLADILSKKYHNSFKTVKNVPCFQASPIPEKKGEKYIIYQGAINKGRGLEELLGAIKKINLKLIIAGDGDITEKIKKMIVENELENKVILKGFLKPAELLAYTKGAYMGYNLLDERSASYYYSLSNKFFDYLHAGIPSLSNNFPEYKLVNEKFKVTLLCDLQEAKIMESIELLLNDHNLYYSMVNNCLEARKIYNWQNEEKHLLDVYQNI
ncbi:MAG: glycosyltransferase [Bacteroidetes bacterium]|nr:glycosyltransferase [Bacteroidota bacterium]